MQRYTLALSCLMIGGVIGVFVARPSLQGHNTPEAAIPRELTSYRALAQKVLPAVVSLEALGRPDPRPGKPADRPPLAEFGSGVIVDPSGVILTNYHVVQGARQIRLRLHDGSIYQTTDILGDAKTDVALIRFKPTGKVPALTLGNSDAMHIGDRVLAVGAPFGLRGSVTHGIISGKGRALHMNMYEDFLQTDAALNPGNSGGPLVNLQGEVVGINSVIKSHSGGFQGVGLALSSNLVRKIMARLLSDGVVRRGYLGVQIDDIEDAALARRLGLEAGKGVLVGHIFEDTPGARAGLQRGDVITAIAGQTIRNTLELQEIVENLPLGKPTEMTIVREGTPRTVAVTIEEQPDAYGVRRTPKPR
jgi:serine protease Do